MLPSKRPCATRRSPWQTARRMSKNGSTPGRRLAGSAAGKNLRKTKRSRRVDKRRPEESASLHEQSWQPDSAHVRRICESVLQPAISLPAARSRLLGLAALAERLGKIAQPIARDRIFREPGIACAARHRYFRLVLRIRLRNSVGARLTCAHRGARPGDRHVHGLLDSGPCGAARFHLRSRQIPKCRFLHLPFRGPADPDFWRRQDLTGSSAGTPRAKSAARRRRFVLGLIPVESHNGVWTMARCKWFEFGEDRDSPGFSARRSSPQQSSGSPQRPLFLLTK